MLVAVWDNLFFFGGFGDSKLVIVSATNSLMLSLINPFSIRYLNAFKLYLGFNFDKFSLIKFLLSIQRHVLDASPNKIDPSMSSPVRSLTVAFKCFFSI